MPDPRFRVLVTDSVDSEGVALLRECPEIEVVERPTMTPDVLEGEIGGYDALVGRSATKVPAGLLERAGRLRVIGRAGVGIDNIDLERATQLGVAVINAPGGNVVSVAELFFGVLISLARRIHAAAASMSEGRWERAQLGGIELHGRRLAVIGVGRIGSEVARRARSFGMEVSGYDPYVTGERFAELGVERAEGLEEALSRADVLTLHTPLSGETRGMIDAAALSRLPPGSLVLNLARGGIVDEDALADALRAGRIAGAALDVFAVEPLPAGHPLRSAPNLLLTPHLGASTAEAQKSVAVEACTAVRNALLTGDLSAALNAVGMGTGDLRPLMELSDRLGRLGRALLPGGLGQVELRYAGPREDAPRPLLFAALQGVLRNVVDQRGINLVNALHVAEERGIETAWTRVAPHGDGSVPTVELRLKSGERSLWVAGAVLAGSHLRVTRINDFHVDVAPKGTLLILRNRDVPGVIGRVGTLLGDEGVNIAEYHQARLQAGGEALAAISIDGRLGTGQLERLCQLDEVLEVRQVMMH